MILYVSFPLVIMTIIFPIHAMKIFLELYQIFLIFMSLYLLYGLILSTLKRKEGTLFSLIGIIAPLLTTINDILYARNIIETGYLLPLGIFIFILFQALSLSYKFSFAFERNRVLTKKLEDLLAAVSKFVPREFLTTLRKEDISHVRLGDQIQRDITIMFADIKNFTQISELLPPEDNFKLINQYLMHVEPIIQKNNGFIDKYIGDGIMALFPNSPEDAILSAIEIQKTIKNFRYSYKYQDITLKICCGIHTGVVMLGVIGSSNRMETTVISDAVNTSSRLEKLNRDFGTDILISEDVLNKLPNKDQYFHRFIGTIILKGKHTPVKVYEIYNHYDEEIKQKYRQTKEKFIKGIENYTKQKIDLAYSLFEEILEYNQNDNPAHFYYQKCKKVLGS